MLGESYSCSNHLKNERFMPKIPLGMYIDPTVPFPSAKRRSIHFVKHGHEFAAPNEYAYERMADAFMSRFLHPNLHECQRATGTFDRIRLDGLTDPQHLIWDTPRR
jgi:hypothetical protein